MQVNNCYHIGLAGNHGAEYAILPGDPNRVEFIAKRLQNPKFLSKSREYTAWTGEISNQKVLVMSTGMGGPSTAIAVEELFKTGIKTFIRVGTCGGMQPEIIGGDLVIATGSVRMEGTTKEYVPLEFPAVADITVTNALIMAAKLSKKNYHAGIVQSKDSFYGQHDPDRMPVGYELKNKWNAYIKAGCLASEMESAALFIVSQILRCRAGAVFNCVWNQEREKAGLSNPASSDNSFAADTAIEAIKILISNQEK